MDIAVATVSHETNTFAAGRTDLEDFAFETGEALLDSFHADRSLGGIVEALRAAEVDVSVRPLAGAATIPGPTVTADAFEAIETALLDRLDDDVDGVCLDLHGSMCVEDRPDPEGALLASIREVVGPDVPITAALDMHATITETMTTHLDGVAGYRTAPHTDTVETGRRAAELLLADLRGEVDLELGWRRLPVLLSGERSETDAEPMTALIDRLEAADERSEILDANYFLGFPWADSPHGGCHALVTGDASGQAAGGDSTADDIERVATDLAAAFWERRGEFDFTTEAHAPADALDVAANESEGPVVIADTGDIPGAGGSQDVTDFLATILDREDLGTPVVAILADPESVVACEQAETGESIALDVGRSVAEGTLLSIEGEVRAVHEADGVTTARVRAADTDVLLADARTNLHRDPVFFSDLDIDPKTREVVVLKSGYLSPDWKFVAARRLFALTPGDTNQTFADLPYEALPRPIYPIDADAEWSA